MGQNPTEPRLIDLIYEILKIQKGICTIHAKGVDMLLSRVQQLSMDYFNTLSENITL